MSVNWFFLAALNHELACSRAAELSRHLTRLASNESDRDRKRETLRHIHANEEIVRECKAKLEYITNYILHINVTFCVKME